MANTRTNQTALLERAVVGPKGIWVDGKDGKKRLAREGEMVFVTPHQARSFSHCLKDPKVAAAEQAVQVALQATTDEGDDS